MAQTILQLWDDLIGDQNKKPTRRWERRWYRRGRRWRYKYELITTKPEVKNEKFINTVQISSWESFTKRSRT